MFLVSVILTLGLHSLNVLAASEVNGNNGNNGNNNAVSGGYSVGLNAVNGNSTISGRSSSSSYDYMFSSASRYSSSAESSSYSSYHELSSSSVDHFSSSSSESVSSSSLYISSSSERPSSSSEPSSSSIYSSEYSSESSSTEYIPSSSEESSSSITESSVSTKETLFTTVINGSTVVSDVYITVSATANANNANAHPHGLSKKNRNIVIGCVVGIGVPLILAALLVFYIFCIQSKKTDFINSDGKVVTAYSANKFTAWWYHLLGKDASDRYETASPLGGSSPDLDEELNDHTSLQDDSYDILASRDNFRNDVNTSLSEFPSPPVQTAIDRNGSIMTNHNFSQHPTIRVQNENPNDISGVNTAANTAANATTGPTQNNPNGHMSNGYSTNSNDFSIDEEKYYDDNNSNEINPRNF